MASTAAFLNARARGLLGAILSHERLAALAALPGRDSVTRELEAGGYFRRSPEPDERLDATQRLTLELDGEYRAALAVLSGAGRTLARAMYGECEIAFLKLVFASVRHGIPPAKRFRITGGYHLLDAAAETALLSAESAADAVAAAPERYRATLDRAVKRSEEEGSLLAVELALDLFALHELWLAVRGLAGWDKASAGTIVGARFDRYNAATAARLRLAYGLSPDETLGYLIHHGQAFQLSHRRALAAAESVAGIVAAVRGTEFERHLADATSIRDVEFGADAVFRAAIDRALTGYPFHLGATIGYLYRKDLEVRALTSIYAAVGKGNTVSVPPELLAA